MKKLKSIKIILVNILIIIFLLTIFELFLGSWLKNDFSYRLSSERNLYRVYKFNFTNHSGDSLYIRDTNGFRVEKDKINPKNIDVIFTGGSTTNQKFLNFRDTIVSKLDSHFNKTKFVNAGIDGLSVKGHINSFDYWFDKINDLKPKYYIFYLGINDQDLLKDYDRSVDQFRESNFKNTFKEYLESNSFIYKNLRVIKTNLYLKFKIDRGANVVNRKTVVYGERDSEKFFKFKDFESRNKLDDIYYTKYRKLLEILIEKVSSRGSKIIFITQTSGYGMNSELFTASRTIIDVCNKKGLFCIDVAKNLDLQYEDFYDSMHLTINGSNKVAKFLSAKLEEVIEP